ncbi:fatty acid synthase-like [Planococcus citri]|uniref:fatty acid synthase-like n=1 Tax=Planococcus citri TaxID=170843 RepID=UPI0031F7AE8A
MNNQEEDPNGVVISGISGAFPNSENVEEFKENLLAGNDMISSLTRSKAEGIKVGLVKTIDRFDYSFFRITHNQAKCMTIGARMLLEKTFEAILDAGYNPEEIKGKNIAVICGVWDTNDEGDPAWDQKPDNYIDIFGRMRFMLSNRISNWLDVHGPSYPVNTACSSSLYAIDHAIKAIQRGQCEGAIVCSTNLCLSMVELFKHNPLLTSKGNSAPFDADAGGYVRAEAVVAFFLQRRKDARRIYANVIHSTTNSDGFKEEGFAFPSVESQVKLYKQFYEEINMDPRKIAYIEAHGTGTKVGDVVEGTSIEQFFCADRNTPLKVGAIKSNMGHGEASAALCGITKMIVAFESGIIPPNLRFNTPNPNIKGLLNGNLQIVSKPTPLEGEYFALNSFGIGGSNGHIVLSPHTKVKKEGDLPSKTIPLLITASGRTEEAVDCILDNVDKNHDNAEYMALFHEIFKNDINGHLYRGYVLLQKNKENNISSKKFFSGEKRPIWFVFSGMGSQWPTMGKSLMEIPIFAESIQRSHDVLLSKKIDLIKIITDDDPKMFDNILNSFVGIAAIQIALVDVLRKLNVQPDGIVGHSVGELGCAYADGCLTAEQMLLAAYYRGLVSLETVFIHGTMAAVGESYNHVKDILPPEIDIACHNGPTSCTISGPTEIMQDFIKTLQEKKIFVQAVNTSNIAYHSRYIAPAEHKLMSYLKTIIPDKKIRSKKWICTSAPEHEWDSDKVKYASAVYYTNNLLNTVYFEESYHHVPNNAVTIEIAPHSLLNAILKRSLPATVDNIPLTMRNHENSVLCLLNALGRLYESGCAMKLSTLYPRVEFPVRRSTPMISPLIKWQHTEQWTRGEMHTDTSQSTERKFVYAPKNEDTAYIQGHIVDGRNLYPAFGYLWLVVETLSMMKNKSISELSVVFENVYFEHALTVPTKSAIRFLISIHERTQYFEVRGNSAIVATGKVRTYENANKEMIDVTPCKTCTSDSNSLPMNKDDFYKELRLRGYNYKGLFKNVEYVDYDGKYGEVSWNNNFVCFMDGMAQITLLQVDTRDLLIPTFISKVVIDFAKHYNALESLDKENQKFPVHFHPYHNLLSSGGIQMSGWKGSEIARQKNRASPVLEKNQFVPYITEEQMNLRETIRICVQIALKNANVMKAITYELLHQDYDPEVKYISAEIADALSDSPLIEPNVNLIINSETVEESNAQDGITVSNEKLPQDKSAILITLSNIRNQTNIMKSILDTLRDDGFIITRESTTENVSFEHLGFNVCFSRKINDLEKIILLNKKTKSGPIKQAIRVKNSSYSWISEIQNVLRNLDPEKQEKLIVYAEKEPTSGILGFFNCLKKEENGTNVRCFFILDPDAPTFSFDDEFYKSQFDKNLNYNIYKEGKWGGYWNLEMDPISDVKCAHAFCTLEERGNLSSFKWVQDSLDPSMNTNTHTESMVNVYYSSLNFKDVMLSVARISLNDSFSFSRLVESYLGCEFSGKNENGDRLMGIVRGKGITTVVESLPYLTWPVPDSITLEEAASIPVVYATVIYAFFFKMNLKEGSSILIHAGSGGIGQAAINICLHYKCNIFTTVGTREKVEFIRKTFPQIPESHIGNSRDTSFRTMIMEETQGRGVDVVLNSLAEDKLRASVRCVAKGGHFLEIGKFDMVKNNLLELGHFLNDIVFYSVQLDVAALNSQSEITVGIFNKLKEMLDQGIIKPIQRTVFQTNEVESAFRFMASGKHVGKIVIKIRDEESNSKAKPTLIRLKAKPRVLCQENKSYVVVGGLGGFGLELIDWLITRGARNVVITSRTGIQNGYQSYRIKIWRSYGAKIVISTADITKKSEVKNLLEMGNALGSVAGIFNLAVVLEDHIFYKQTVETFSTVLDPKAIATDHLDQLSRKMCPHLEYFVVFSSVIANYGNVEQTNYGFANSITERICEARQADNLPALAIQWGAIGEVGIVSEFLKHNTSVTIGGYAQQKVKSCLETINYFMKQKNPVVCSRIIAEKRKTDSDIITTVANALGIKDLKTISLSWTLPELGMDSILGMELKQILEAEFNIFLTPEDLRTMTFAKLYKLKEGDKNVLDSGTANRTSTQLQFFLNKEISDQLVLRIPFLDGKMQQPISIDENPTVFVFPGIEGLALTMEPLAKNLPVQVLCFQYHFVEAKDFIRELSNHFSSYILEKLPSEQKFNIIGHSFGTAIAMEVAEILEKNGRTGHIWLLDSSPTVVKMGITQKIEEHALLNDEMIQNQVCIRVIQTFMPGLPKEKYLKYLEASPNWESKKKTCFSMLPGGEKNEKSMHYLLDKSYSILKSIPGYEKSHYRLQSPGVLIRCVKNELDLPLDDAYGLTQNFENPIEVHKIDEVDHFSILLHPKTTEIIMKSSAWKKD